MHNHECRHIAEYKQLWVGTKPDKQPVSIIHRVIKLFAKIWFWVKIKKFSTFNQLYHFQVEYCSKEIIKNLD